MDARKVQVLFCLLLLLVVRNTSQQSSSKKRNSKNSKKDCANSAAMELLKEQINNITLELNLLKEQQALHTVCLRGTKIPGKCLLADGVKRSFHAASDHCAAQGGSLVTPTSADHNQQLLNYVRQSIGPAMHVWLGVNDMVTEGRWVDQSGGGVRFANWETDVTQQPDGGSTQNCAVLDVAANGKWFDESCRQERASVCEFNIV
ncbi:tetranectin [Nelusetta ayraudi]|uniref:tetranectin n=1 Tax=Nelusetta ayraudi TaxID=303726 RepID=UPI003F6E569E